MSPIAHALHVLTVFVSSVTVCNVFYWPASHYNMLQVFAVV